MFSLDSFVANQGTPYGMVGTQMMNGSDLITFDPGLMRPYRDERGRVWVDVTTNVEPKRDKDGRLTFNKAGQIEYARTLEPQLVMDRVRAGLPVLNVSNALTLRKDQWILLDAVAMKAARPRMRAYTDLRNANSLGGFDGMATPILEHEVMNDPGEALVDMDGLSEGRGFQPTFGLQGTPLPLVHSSFFLSSRFLASSRSKGQPADTVRAEVSGRRVGEMIERMTIGTADAFQYGVNTEYEATAKVYGYITHPDRITKTDLTASTSFAGATFVNEVIAMRELAYASNFFGPFICYVSTAYDAKLDQDYIPTGGDSTMGTVRQRVRLIDGITDVRRLDYLGGDVVLLVQMTEDVCRAVNGMEIMTVQWETKGGMQLNFKVMGIQVPQIRSVYITGTTGQTGTKKTGIVHGTTS